MPCIERLPDGRGCPHYAEPDGSRCSQCAGLAPKSKSKGTTTAWRKARLLALERDGWKCTRCGKTQAQAKAEGLGLEVHHLAASSRTPGRSIDRDEHPVDELQTLCRACHQLTYKRKTRPTWAQAREALKRGGR